MKKKIAEAPSRRDTVEAAYNLISEREGRDDYRTAEERAVKLASSETVRVETMRMARMKSAQVLRRLRARAAAMAKRLPTPQQYADFYRKELLSALNELSGNWGRCEECGARFKRTRKDKRYCSDPCRARAGMRGREKSGNGRSAEANARVRQGEKISQHMQTCAVCRTGKTCYGLNGLMAQDDLMSKWGGSDDLEAGSHRGGRVQNRKTPAGRRET